MPDTSASLQQRDLERAIAKLPIEKRQVIVIVGLEDLFYVEVAEVLLIPVGTVRSRLSRPHGIARNDGYGERTAPARNHQEDLADSLGG